MNGLVVKQLKKDYVFGLILIGVLLLLLVAPIPPCLCMNEDPTFIFS